MEILLVKIQARGDKRPRLSAYKHVATSGLACQPTSEAACGYLIVLIVVPIQSVQG